MSEYMSIIKTLVNSKDDEAERDVIKKKLEKSLEVSDQKLTKLVADHYGELHTVMQSFRSIFKNLRVSLENLHKSKQRLVSARELLISKLENLKKLSEESKVNQRILVLLDREEQMEAPRPEDRVEERESSPDLDETETYFEPTTSKQSNGLFSFSRSSYGICFQEYYSENK